jgi:hypothetical protein
LASSEFDLLFVFSALMQFWLPTTQADLVVTNWIGFTSNSTPGIMNEIAVNGSIIAGPGFNGIYAGEYYVTGRAGWPANHCLHLLKVSAAKVPTGRISSLLLRHPSVTFVFTSTISIQAHSNITAERLEISWATHLQPMPFQSPAFYRGWAPRLHLEESVAAIVVADKRAEFCSRADVTRCGRLRKA